MTHAWVEITSGRRNVDDGGRRNLEMIANMLCEIVGFELPFPDVFQDEGVSLSDDDSLAFGSSRGPQ